MTWTELIVRTAAIGMAGILMGGVVMGDQVLFGCEGEQALSRVEQHGAEVSIVDGSLQMVTGHDRPWPGIVLLPPDGPWDLSQFQTVTMDITNCSATVAPVGVRIDNPGADGRDHCLQIIERIPPGETMEFQVRLIHPLVDMNGKPVKLFGMRGYPDGTSGGQRQFEPANVTQMLVFLAEPTEDHTIKVGSVRAIGTHQASLTSAEDFFPMIDEFGQYMHRDWPRKTHSVDQMLAALKDEKQELAANPGPEGWDEYGGWEAGPTLEATGFFRAEKHEGQWWLVDPAGKLFISHGVDCVQAWGDHTPIEDRENWFAWLPEQNIPFAEFYGRSGCLLNYYAGRTPRTYDFGAANMARKYGFGATDAMHEMIHARLRSWGVNTIANWSDREVYLQRKTPYVATINCGGKLLEGSEGYWGKFRDVFDPGFGASVRERMATQADTTAGDPWCIGYFVDNEIAWGNDSISLAVAALLSPPDQRAKLVFLEDLKGKYKTIEALNDAWGTAHESWRAMLEAREAPDVETAREDLEAFYTKTAETYFKTIRDAIKAVAPHQLYLGCRFAWVNRLAVDAAAKYCDVVSYNLYRRSVADFELPGGHDVPLIIGEFHFGALDRGMFHPGLVELPDQHARADAYRSYLYGMLEHAQFVGCHWFKYRDEPVTGRTWDDENYQIGLVDVCDTPYPETIEALREVGTDMYEYRAHHATAGK